MTNETTMNPFLHYDSITLFKKEFYKDLLTSDHLKPGQINIEKLTLPDGGKDEYANFWGYVLEKNGVKYLLPAHDKNHKEIKLRDILPLVANDVEKVAYRGVVYFLINKPTTAKFRPIKTMSFKQMINTFCSFKHTNPDHQKLLWLMGVTQMIDRANFRISTPAGFGKDCVVDTLGSLIGGCNTIENPTLAKLEYMTFNKWLAVNEVIDIPKAEWSVIEQFLLATGAHKPEVTKHSRAVAGGTKEVLDISKFSISLMYNDIDHYPDSKTYFDETSKKAVLDRFPAFRLQGHFDENFNEIRTINLAEYVKNHWDEYRNLIYAFTYYKENIQQELHHYRFKGFPELPERWKTNIGRLINVIDLYSESQEEFDYWINLTFDSIADYKEMLKYPTYIELAQKRLSEKDYAIVTETIKKVDSYKDKNKMLSKYNTEEVKYTATHNITFW